MTNGRSRGIGAGCAWSCSLILDLHRGFRHRSFREGMQRGVQATVSVGNTVTLHLHDSKALLMCVGWQVGLQRVRFQMWGEGVGLPSGRSAKEPKIPYNTQLDLPHIQPCIACALEEIRQLLNSVTAIDGRYGVKAISEPEEETTTLSGSRIFQKSFDRLRKRIRKGQKEKSIL